MLRVYASRGIAVCSCALFISFVARITIFKLVAQQRYANSKKSRLSALRWHRDWNCVWDRDWDWDSWAAGKDRRAHDEADFVEHGPFGCFSLECWPSLQKGELEGGRER